MSTSNYKPARGLTTLTWSQVEHIDLLAKLACELTRGKSGDATIEIVFRNGNPRYVTIPDFIKTCRESLELKPVTK